MNWRQKVTGEGRVPSKQPKPPTGQLCCRKDFAAASISGRGVVDNPDPENSIEVAATSAAAAWSLNFFNFISWSVGSLSGQ